MTLNGDSYADIITLLDDKGVEHEFALIDRFAVDWAEYAILVPVYFKDGVKTEENMETEPDAYIFRIEEDDNGEDVMSEVDNEDEWSKVAAVWENRLEEMSIPTDDDDHLS